LGFSHQGLTLGGLTSRTYMKVKRKRQLATSVLETIDFMEVENGSSTPREKKYAGERNPLRASKKRKGKDVRRLRTHGKEDSWPRDRMWKKLGKSNLSKINTRK